MNRTRRYLLQLLAVVALVLAFGLVTPAGAQWVSNFFGYSFTSSAPSGANGFACKVNGCRIDFGTGANDYLAGTGVYLYTPAQFTASQFTGYNYGSQFGETAAAGARVSGNTTDTAAAIGLKVGNLIALTTAGAKVVSFYSDNLTTEVRAIDKNGADVYPAKCDSSGSPGAATCNQAAGQAAIAAAASSVVITNSLVSTTSIVRATLQFQDAACLYIRGVVPAAGSFTINVNAACTSNSKVAWVLDAK